MEKPLIAITLTIIIAAILVTWGVNNNAMLCLVLLTLTPFCMGLISTVIYGYENDVTKKQMKRVSIISFVAFTFIILIVYGVEEFLYAFVAAPLAILLIWIGHLIGFRMISKHNQNYLCQ